MKLITWNVQWCRGVDGHVDPSRIAWTARAFCDFDVLCVQEVAVNFPRLAGSNGEDQMVALAAALPGYVPLFGAATDVVDASGRRHQFGNAIFSRLPVLQVFAHLLPWPADPTVPSMQRLALEAIVQAETGPLRVICTHLEYYSLHQRMAQVEALRRLHREACGHALHPRPEGEPDEPFAARPRPRSAIFCGDFNFRPGSLEYQCMVTPEDDPAVPAPLDAWRITRGGEMHPMTVGLYDPAWPEAYCCDYAFVTADLRQRVVRMDVEPATQASDHQPLLIVLDA